MSGRAPAAPLAGADFTDPERVIRGLYDLLSGPAGGRDWEAFALLFHQNATMGASIGKTASDQSYLAFTPGGYVERNDAFFRAQAFYVEETHRVTQRFGEIMHVFSTYRFRTEPPGGAQQSGRGINSIQLIRHAGRWWIISIQYTNERQDLRLPRAFGG